MFCILEWLCRIDKPESSDLKPFHILEHRHTPLLTKKNCDICGFDERTKGK